MKNPLKNKKFRKALKYAVIALGIYIMLRVIHIVYVVSIPDMPPFDDSDMLPERPKISAQENGFDALMKAVGRDEKIPKGYFSDLEKIHRKRNFSVNDKKMVSLEKKYSARYNRMREALNFSHFISPPRQKIYHKGSPYTYDKVFSGLREMPTYAVVLAWHEAHQGNERQALKHIEFALRLGHALQNESGDLFFIMLGDESKRMTLQGINSLLDNRYLSYKSIPELLRMIREFEPSLQSWRQWEKCNYENKKLMTYAIHKGQIGDYGVWDNFYSKYVIKPNIMVKIHYDQSKFMAEKVRIPYCGADKQLLAHPYRTNKGLRKKFSAWLNPSAEVAKLLEAIGAPNFFRGFQRRFLLIDSWRMMQIKLTVLSYFSEHGKLPESLDDVTPAYIQTIPIDPMDGKPFKYNPKKGIIWSVGFNGKDDSETAANYLFDKDFDTHKNYFQKEKDIVLKILPKK